jgi:hypothetical protein
MQRWIRLVVGVTLAVNSSGQGASPSENDDTLDALRQEVAALRSEVARLQAAQGEDWLTEQRAEEIKGLVLDVLADADTRASLQQNGLTAGWDKDFYLASADGNWLLRIRGQIQVRYLVNNASGTALPEQTLYGFEVRRAKLKLDGHVFDRTWKYVLNIACDYDNQQFNSALGALAFSGTGQFFLDDAIIMKDFENGFEVWAGQFKPPFLQEELISSTKQQVVERSLVNEEFNQDRFTGVMGVWSDDRVKVQVSFGDGFGSQNLPAYYVPISAGDMQSSLGLTGRVDWVVMGDWKQFEQMTSPDGSTDGLKLGAAVHWEQDKYGTFLDGSTGRSRFWTWTADLMWEADGWNVFTYVVGRHTSGAIGSADQYGFVVQGGYRFGDDWEGYARYEWGDNGAAGAEDLNVVTVGATYFVNKHRLKWTSDVGYAMSAVESTWRSIGANWRASNTGQVVIRSQVQLLF